MKKSRGSSISSDEVLIKKVMRHMAGNPASLHKFPVKQVSFINNDYLKKLRSKPFKVDETNRGPLSLEELRNQGSLLDKNNARTNCLFKRSLLPWRCKHDPESKEPENIHAK